MIPYEVGQTCTILLWMPVDSLCESYFQFANDISNSFWNTCQFWQFSQQREMQELLQVNDQWRLLSTSEENLKIILYDFLSNLVTDSIEECLDLSPHCFNSSSEVFMDLYVLVFRSRSNKCRTLPISWKSLPIPLLAQASSISCSWDTIFLAALSSGWPHSSFLGRQLLPSSFS